MNARKILTALALAGGMLLASQAALAATQASLPFYAATNIQPNVMIMLDSSANMSATVKACGDAGQQCKKFAIAKRVLTGSTLLTGVTGDFIYDPEAKGNSRLQDAMNPNAFVRIVPLNCTPAPPPGGELGTTCTPQASGNYFTMLLANDIVMEFDSDSVMAVATNLGDYMLDKGYTSSNTLYITDSGQVDFTFDNYSTGGVNAPRKIYTLTTTLDTTYSKTFTSFFIRNYWVTVPPSYYYEFDSHLTLSGTSAGANEAGPLDIIKDVYVIPVTWKKTCYMWQVTWQSCWQLDTSTTPVNFVFADDQDLNMIAKNYNYKQYLKAFKREYLRTRLNSVDKWGNVTPLYNTYGFRPVTDPATVFFNVRDSLGLRAERRKVFELVRTCGSKPPASCTTTGVQCFPIPTCDPNPRQYPNSTLTDLTESNSKPLVVDLLMKSIPRVDTGDTVSPKFTGLVDSCSGVPGALDYQAEVLDVRFSFSSIQCPFSFYYGSSSSFDFLDDHIRTTLGLSSNPTTISIDEPAYNNFFKNMNYEYISSVDNGVVDIYHNRARFGMSIYDSGTQPSQNSDLDFDLIDLSGDGLTPTPLNETWMDRFGYNFTFTETEEGANLIANIANDDEDPFHDQTMQNAIIQVEDIGPTPGPSALYNLALYFDWVGSPVRLTVNPSNFVTWFGDPAPGVAAITGDPAVIGDCRQNFLIFISGGGSGGASWGMTSGTKVNNYLLHSLDRLMHGTCGDNCDDDVSTSSAGKNPHSTDLFQEVKPFVVHFDEDAGPGNFLEEMLLLGCYSGVSWFTEPDFLIDGETVTDEDFKDGNVTLEDLNDDGNDEVCSSFLYWAVDEDSLKAVLVKILNSILSGSYTRSAPVFDPQEESVVAGFFEIKPGKILWEGHLFNFDVSGVSDLNAATVEPIDAAVVMNTLIEDDPLYWSKRDIFTVRCENGATCSDWIKTDFIESNAGHPAHLQVALQGGETTKPPKTVTDAEDLINFIRGEPDSHFDDGSNHKYTLGAIYHSQPKIVGPIPDILSNPLFENIDKYVKKHQARPALIYVGANDGMLHAFFMNDPTTGTRENDSTPPEAMQEYFAYIPNAVLETLNLLRSFQWYYVDGSPFAAEVYIQISHDNTAQDLLKPERDFAATATNWGTEVWDRVSDCTDPDNPGTEDPAFCGCKLRGTDSDYMGDMCWRTVMLCGLRDGGRSYFALDVTDASSVDSNFPADTADGDDQVAPKILPMWEFNDPHLANTWSTPFMAELLDSGTSAVFTGAQITQLTALFGGGMTGDTVEYNMGNYFYVVNMDTGKLFEDTTGKVVSRFLIPDHLDPGWKTKVEAGRTVDTSFDSTNHVPSDPTVVDKDEDGIADIVYFGDLQGRMWKLNLHAAPDEDLTWSQRKLCLFYDTGDLTGDLKENSPPGCPVDDADCLAEQRPLFYAPTVIPEPASNGLLVIFGTGHIESSGVAQDQTTVNRIFAVLDTDELEAGNTLDNICSYGTLWNDTIRQSGNCPLCDEDIEYPYDLEPGEKIISKPFVLEDKLFFQTYTPITDNVCDPGEARFWVTDAYTFFGLASNTNPGQKYIALDEFTVSGFAMTNKFGPVIFSPPMVPKRIYNKLESPLSVISWGEGLSFGWQ